MSRHGTKPKKPQKLIIPKGTIDFNDTAIIEIPPEYRNQDVVIAKKSRSSVHSRSRIDESSGIGSRYSQRSNYSSQTYDPWYDEGVAESSCQTALDETDIERLMEDLEAYYQAQKKFLIKSSTLFRKKADEYQNQQTAALCDCSRQQGCSGASPSGCTSVIVLKNKCFETEDSYASMNRAPQPCSTRARDAFSGTRINASHHYDADLSTSRNVPAAPHITQPFSFYSYGGPANETFRSQNVTIPQDTTRHDLSYDLFREGAGRSFDESKSGPITSSQTRFDATIPGKPILRRNHANSSGVADMSTGNFSFGQMDASTSRDHQTFQKPSSKFATLMADDDIRALRNESETARKNLDDISDQCDDINCPAKNQDQK
ncbi:uncharacterized protein [Diabrotica undecimpunctata]|uniref:uncharacterized protein isoform X2 n=1 Tax=Diabrotica undecimpunctata TaxID=50387 RepID=UPI003B635C70